MNKLFRSFKIDIDKINMNKLKAAVCVLAAIFGVCILSLSVNAKPSYEMPDYIRVYLTSNFANQSKVSITNSDITLGYFDDDNDFDELQNLSCNGGFYFLYNDSQRYMSSETYDDIEDVLDEIENSNDYMPLYLGYNKYKIVTKPNREVSDLCSEVFDNLNSIVVISNDNKEVAIFDGDTPLIKDSDDEFITIKNKNGTSKTYRGEMKLVVDSTGISAINYVDFEEYLYGVVTCEMPKAWNFEAIKAQALTARTYALKRVLLYSDSRKYDLVDTTSDQVYNGVTGESDNSIKATNKTTGEVIIYVGDETKYKDKLIDAFFSSCHGGVSANSEDVWIEALPYCRSIVDKYEKPNSYTNWEINFTLNDLQNAANKVGANIGNVTGCTVTTAKDSERVVAFNLVGTKGNYSIKKDAVRTFFNKYFTGTCYSNNFELFSGSSPKFEEVKEDIKVYTLGNTATKAKENIIKNLYMYNDSNHGTAQITKAVSVINGDKNISKIEIENVTKVETDDSKMAKGTYKIVGSGFGHGVGMSQYGARDMADAGFKYDEIIKYYYQDVDIITID